MKPSSKRLLWAAATVAAIAVVLGAALQWAPVPLSSLRVAFNSLVGTSTAAPAVVLERLQPAPGFHVSVFASELPEPRMLRFTAGGDLLVSNSRDGTVQLLERDRNGDGRADSRRAVLKGLKSPHGIDVNQGWLYVGETHAVGRIRFDEQSGRTEGEYERIVTGLTGGGHWSKTLRIGPDDYLYLAQGSTCNVCEEKDRRRATIMRFQRDGSGGEIYASGLRNSVGFDWAPWDNALYATDNGRDMLGDDFPPCELNRIEAGGFYGWPYVNGFGEPDPDYAAKATGAKQQLVQRAIKPVFGFRAHNAPLGIVFLRTARMPAGYERAALVALHGSWNRSVPDGYKVVSLHWADDGSIEQRDFLTGFERAGDVVGRPVDIAEGPDGALYISDDHANAIYRVAYGTETAPPAVAAAPAPAPQQLPVDRELTALDAAQRRELAAHGERLFKRYACGNCHEGPSRGMRTMRPLEQLAERYTMAQLQSFLQTPTPPMPVFPLNDDERRQLAVYLLSR